MLWIVVLLACCIFLLLSFAFVKERNSLNSLPPVLEKPLFFGSSSVLLPDGKSVYEKIAQGSKNLDTPLMTVKHFGMHFVLVTEYKTLRRLVVDNSASTSGRIKPPAFSWLARHLAHKRGLICDDGAPWKLHRKLAMSSLRELGYGITRIEGRIVDEGQNLVRNLPLGKQPIDIGEAISTATTNIVTGLFFGYTFHPDDPKYRHLNRIVTAVLNTELQPDFRYILPFKWMKDLPLIKSKKFDDKAQLFEDLRQFVRAEIEARYWWETSRDDILSIFMQASESDDSQIHHMTLVLIFCDLLIAGTDTTASAISWALKALAADPGMQERVFEELQHLDQSKLSIQSLANLPFTNAVIHEALRFGCVVPQLVPHRVEREFSFDNYTFPKNTIIMGNVWSISRDPKVWRYPEEFNPENFLCPETGNFQRREEFMAFGQGPRSCMGEKLARSEIFIIMATIIINCQIRKADAEPWDMNQACGSITRKPTPFKVFVSPR